MEKWRKILAAVDEKNTSMQALQYLGEFTGCTEGLELTLLYVYPEPPPYYFREGHNLQEYREEKEKFARQIFAQYRDVLQKYGVTANAISTIFRMAANGSTISQTILQVQAEGDYGTVVVGKRGVTKAEEFLFGSISNTLVRASRDFTVWVVG